MRNISQSNKIDLRLKFLNVSCYKNQPFQQEKGGLQFSGRKVKSVAFCEGYSRIDLFLDA